MELTQLGQHLVTPVQELLKKIDSTVTTCPLFDLRRENRHVKIMASDYAISTFLNLVLRRATREAPEVQFELSPLSESPFEELSQREADFLVIPRKFANTAYPLQNLFEDSFCAVVWNHNTAVHSVLDNETFKNSKHVTPWLGRRRSPTLKEHISTDLGIADNVAARTFDFSTAASMIVGTDLIATMPRRLAKQYAQHFPLRMLELPVPLPVITLCLQWHKQTENDAFFEWLRCLMTEVSSTMDNHDAVRSHEE